MTRTRQVLDIAIPSMLRTARHSTRALTANLLSEVDLARADAARVAVVRQGRERDVAALELGGGDQLPLALVPRGQDLGGGRAAQDARVDETCELDVRDMPGRAVDALKVPDCLCAACCCVSLETLGYRGTGWPLEWVGSLRGWVDLV